MKVFISFAELSEYILKHFGKSLSFSQLQSHEVLVVYKQKMLFTTIDIPVHLFIEDVDEEGMVISYEGKFGVEKIITCALSLLKRRHPELQEVLQSDKEAPNYIDIVFSKLKQTQKLRQAVLVKGIVILENGVEVELGLK